MSINRRFYWMKLKSDFFEQKEIKKLRKLAGGDTYTIIYQKLLLLSINTEGRLSYDGIEDTFAEEVALIINEDIDNVKMTLSFLEKYNMIELIDNEYNLPAIQDLIGTETASTIRSRQHRLKQKEMEIQLPEMEEVKQIEAPKKKVKKTESKIHYGDYISFTEDEHRKLCEKFGEKEVKRMIDKMNLYKGSTGRKYKSDYMAFLSWKEREYEQNKVKPKSNYNDMSNYNFE